MEAIALYALTGLLVLLVARLRFEWALGVVVGCLLLVPAYLLLPFTGFAGTRVTRIVFLAFAMSFPARVRRGEIDRQALRPPPLLIALVMAAALLAVTGIGFAGTDLTLRSTFEVWLIFVDQLTMLVIGVVACRVLGARRVADIVLLGLGTALLIGAWEHVSGRSWSQLFPVPGSQSRILLNPLEQRGGARVRAGALFALEFGWVIAVIVPLAFQRLVGHLSGRWRTAVLVLLAGSGSVLVWTRSRSALVACAAAVVLLLVVSGFRRRVAWPIIAAAVVTGIFLLSTSAVDNIYDLDRPAEATTQDVRIDRLPGILAEVAPQPLDGLGLGGLRSRGYVTPDDGWLLLYTDTGAVGLAAYAATVLLAIVTAARALLRSPPGERRDLAAAIVAGLVVWVGANAAYDAANLALSGPLFWLIASIGLVLGEQAPPARPPHRSAHVVAAGTAAILLIAGCALPFVYPEHVSRTYQFQDVPTKILANTSADYSRPAFSAETTVCDAMNALDETEPGRITCIRPGAYQQNSGDYSVYVPGVGRLRTEAGSTAQLDELEERMLDVGSRLVHFELRRTSGDVRGLPAPIATAPVWIAIALVILITFRPSASMSASARRDDRRAPARADRPRFRTRPPTPTSAD